MNTYLSQFSYCGFYSSMPKGVTSKRFCHRYDQSIEYFYEINLSWLNSTEAATLILSTFVGSVIRKIQLISMISHLESLKYSYKTYTYQHVTQLLEAIFSKPSSLFPSSNVLPIPSDTSRNQRRDLQRFAPCLQAVLHTFQIRN